MKAFFTMLDLLIVVITMALLVGLLFPWQRRSSRIGSKIGCTGTLKEINLALFLWISSQELLLGVQWA